MKTLFAAAAVLGLSACSAMTSQCVQPDPVQPAHTQCWDQGVNCGQPITPVNAK